MCVCVYDIWDTHTHAYIHTGADAAPRLGPRAHVSPTILRLSRPGTHKKYIKINYDISKITSQTEFLQQLPSAQALDPKP